MDYKNTNAADNTITRNLIDFQDEVENIYEAIVIMSKRANQISTQMKEELNMKLQEFASYTDNLEEIFENREQIEISKYYEKLPKPVLIATQEFLEKNIYIKKPASEK